jgi:hypothetical protein
MLNHTRNVKSYAPNVKSYALCKIMCPNVKSYAPNASAKHPVGTTLPCQRPYHVECTGSRQITEVKQRWAWIVLGWETAWEHQVLLAFEIILH